MRNSDGQPSDRSGSTNTGWSDLSGRLNGSWSSLVGVGVFVIGLALHWVFALAAIAKMLILGGLGWIARDTSIAISSRLKRSRESDDAAGAAQRAQSFDAESTSAQDANATPPTRSSIDVEQQIIELLDDNDGQLRQKYLVDRVDRSKATVSKYLSELEDGGEVVKFSRGRENIVYRPYAVPEQIQADD